jgi:hypothetical protein
MSALMDFFFFLQRYLLFCYTDFLHTEGMLKAGQDWPGSAGPGSASREPLELGRASLLPGAQRTSRAAFTT